MIRLIVATDPNGVIGVKYKHVDDGSPPVGGLGTEGPKRNWYYRWKMPWYYKQDLRRFKRTTMGGVLVMGRRTFESLPGILPGRHHLLLTRDDGFFQNSIFDSDTGQVSYANSLEEAVNDLKEHFEGQDIWIAGGNEIYKLFLEAGCVEEIDHTFVPEVNTAATANLAEVIRFDMSVLDDFELVDEVKNPLDERLTHRRFKCPLPVFKP